MRNKEQQDKPDKLVVARVMKINTSANASVFIFHKSGHSEFTYHLVYSFTQHGLKCK